MNKMNKNEFKKILNQILGLELDSKYFAIQMLLNRHQINVEISFGKFSEENAIVLYYRAVSTINQRDVNNGTHEEIFAFMTAFKYIQKSFTACPILTITPIDVVRKDLYELLRTELMTNLDTFVAELITLKLEE